MTHETIIWLAAWLEGEGWFGLSGNSISIQATSTDRDIIERVASMFNTYHIYEKLKHKETHKQAYTVRLTGERAATIMRAILPYMGNRRRDKIETLLVHHAQKGERRSAASKRRWADPEFKTRTSLAIKLARQGGGNQYTNRKN